MILDSEMTRRAWLQKMPIALTAILIASSASARTNVFPLLVDCTSANPYARHLTQCNRKPHRSQLKCWSAVYEKRDPKTEIGTVSGWECVGD